MMVENHDDFRHIQKGFTLTEGRAVRIHNHKNGLRIDNGLCLLVGDKHILVEIPAVAEHVDPGPDRTVDVTQHDVSLLIQHFCRPVNTDGGTETVDVGDLVAHDHDFLAVFDKFPERLSFHTGLHAGIFLHLLGFSAVVGDLVVLFYYRLIAAAAKSQLNGDSRKFIVLLVTAAVDSDTDT